MISSGRFATSMRVNVDIEQNDKRFMAVALHEAALAHGYTSPNPMVGAVLVRDGKIVGQGHHRAPGSAHAEIAALEAAEIDPRGATLYVNLEPCNHVGRTGPCTDAIIEAGIIRVVVAQEDPNPNVQGGGIPKLRQAGLEVVSGVLEADARRLNEAWLYSVVQRRPWVVAKIAASIDGKVATRTGESQWITGEEARAVGHRLRGECAAVLVGIGTVLADNPQLTCRSGAPDPLRVVLDSNARLPIDARLLSQESNARTLCVVGPEASAAAKEALRHAGAEVMVARTTVSPAAGSAVGGLSILNVLDELYHMGIVSVLVEGGPQVLGGFFDSNVVNKVHAFIAPLVIGGQQSLAAVGGLGPAGLAQATQLHDVQLRQVGADIYVCGYTKAVL